MSSPFTSFLAQHFDQINDYLATFFDGQATSADIERYLYTPLSAFTANAGKRENGKAVHMAKEDSLSELKSTLIREESLNETNN